MISNTFVAKTTIESAKVNQNFRELSASGIISMYGGSADPEGWLICDGRSLAVGTYPDLFSAIGYLFGGAGANFNIPNFKGRGPMGLDATQTEFNTMGKTGGEKAHTLAIAELPAHYHTVDPPSSPSGGITANHQHAHDNEVWINTGGSSNKFFSNGSSWYHNTVSIGGRGAIYTGYVTSDHAHYTDIAQFNSGSTGTGTALNVLQPFLTVNFIIKK